MTANVISLGLTGIQGYRVIAEVDISSGLPGYETVGLPDMVVKESRERIRAAIRNTGFEFPLKRVTVNLAPADTRKEGSVYDLPIAVGVLAASEQLPPGAADGAAFVGELGLNGEVRGVGGILPMLIAAREQGIARVFLPRVNADEASCLEHIDVIPVGSLDELVDMLRGERPAVPLQVRSWQSLRASAPASTSDLSMVRGQLMAKRALEVAAAGGHNVLMIGPPGSGKTMLARCLPSILPDLTFEEAMEITKIHSIAGALGEKPGWVTVRPFRSPHHSASSVSITGGGQKLHPGEISLAHFGVLFLDELPEFDRGVLEAMRQPLEDGFVTITRAVGAVEFPSRFMLVASMNPCPCGNFGSSTQPCRCTPVQIQRYLNRVSGPLLDRIDIQIEVEAVPFGEINAEANAESSAAVRGRVNEARRRQLARYRGEDIFCNAQMTPRLQKRYCGLDTDSQKLMERVFNDLHLSARAYTRILKVARTIADLMGEERVSADHLAEAVQYRSLDRKYWR